MRYKWIELMDGWADKWMNELMDGWADKWMNELTVGLKNG